MLSSEKLFDKSARNSDLNSRKKFFKGTEKEREGEREEKEVIEWGEKGERKEGVDRQIQ